MKRKRGNVSWSLVKRHANTAARKTKYIMEMEADIKQASPCLLIDNQPILCIRSSYSLLRELTACRDSSSVIYLPYRQNSRSSAGILHFLLYCRFWPQDYLGTMDQPQGLRSLFTTAKDEKTALASRSDTNIDTYQDDVKRTIAKFHECQRQVSILSLFSSNESLDDISTVDIQYWHPPLA